MDAGLTPARQARAQHRHELRTLAYVTLDQANGGIVRNLTNGGIGVQVVAAVRPKQQLRVRFELRYPRLQVETRAEVVWATFSGQCGIRFLDMPPQLQHQINQWIFGNLLEGICLHTEHSQSIFAPSPGNGSKPAIASSGEVEQEDGLLVSPTPMKVIALPMRREPPMPAIVQEEDMAVPKAGSLDVSNQLDWLSQPLSGRALAWTVDVLVVVASVLLFTLIFLSVTREAPPWPLAIAALAVLMMSGMYWLFFSLFAGASLGTKLARIADADTGSNPQASRFR
ncbi:MAG TPA: PilZ domain-containing protein [Candidatus Binatia bacterium]|nr:PilZ domain-containing protein [Candidatus Binatia bacterium]